MGDIITNYSLKAAIEKYKKEKQNKSKSKEIENGQDSINVTQSNWSSIIELVNESGANGVSLNELAQRLNLNSLNDRNDLLKELKKMMEDLAILIKNNRYYKF